MKPRSQQNIESAFRHVLVVAGLIATATLSPAAFAAGGDSGGSGGGSSGSSGGSSGGNSGANICPPGSVWSQSLQQCVKQSSGVLPDDEMTDYAYRLAQDERFEEALDVLNLLKDPNTPKALNYRGYVTRHLGRIDEGIDYYLKSVQLDPNYAQVREYLGEAYVIKGRLDLANEQLKVIESICGTECEEYEDLAEAISDPSDL
jgi:tetratricopeptide (TPR) repeat protein